MKNYRTTLKTALSVFACILIFVVCLVPQAYAATWRVNNSTSLGGEVCSQWQANHAYGLGARVVCRVAYGTQAARAFVYECTSAGTSHATTEPSWPTTVGNTVVDNGATWTCRSPSDGSWDNASCYLHYILNHTTVAGGDSVYIDDGHSEAVDLGGTTRYTLKGSTTPTQPIYIYCVDKSDDSLSVGALVKHTDVSYGMYIQGYGYSYGVQYENSTTTGKIQQSTEGAWVFESDGSDVFKCTASGIDVGDNYAERYSLTIINGGINLSTGDIRIYNGTFTWIGGTLTVGSGTIKLFSSNDAYGKGSGYVSDVDLSALDTGDALVDVSDAGDTDYTFLRCKLPAGEFVPITGTWDTGSLPTKERVILHHCSSASATYDFYEAYYVGICQDETTIVRTGGASDGTTAISIKMVTNANASEVSRDLALASPAITGWTSSTTEKTFTIEFVHDSETALQDDEIWMELEYPANNTDGLGAIAKSKCAILGTPADTTDSSETWTTTGLTNPNTRKLSVTVTPGKAGPITAKVYLAKPSTTVYIDPKITEN
jgi:hypothetical protein